MPIGVYVRSNEIKENLRLKNIGKKATLKTKLKMSKSQQLRWEKIPLEERAKLYPMLRKGKNANKNNPIWKGDKVGYMGVHGYIRRHKPKPNKCEICNRLKPLELSNISGKYKRNLSDWEWICRKCHMQKDGRLSKLGKYERSSKDEKI